MVETTTGGLKEFCEQEGVELLTPPVMEIPRRTRAGGLMATENSLDLIYPFTACRRMRKSYGWAQLIAWLTIPLSLGATVLFCALGIGGILTAAAVTLWQMLITGIAVTVALVNVNRKQLYLLPDAPKTEDTNKKDRS